MSFRIEDAYQRLAEACDAVPAGERELFLAKLALCLADAVQDMDRLEAAIRTASRYLEADAAAEGTTSDGG